jgi:hypothetical protein
MNEFLMVYLDTEEYVKNKTHLKVYYFNITTWRQAENE